MRKLLFTIAVTLIFVLNGTAQDTKFGATAGFLNAGAKVKFGGDSVSDTEAGFYVGLIADFEASEKFHVQPELLYANVNESSALFIPVLGKIYVAESFSLHVGPQFGISLEETGEDSSSFSFELAGGLGYDITDQFFIEARYAQQLNNAYTGDLDITARGNGLFVGIGYTF